MNLDECLSALSWHTVTFIAKEGKLLIHAPSLVVNDNHKAIINQYKSLILSMIMEGIPHTPNELLNAFEAYDERYSIMIESQVSSELAHTLSLDQVHQILKHHL